MSTQEIDLDELVAIAVGAAQAAGDLLTSGRPDDLGVWHTKSSPTDVVTVMDKQAEKLIGDYIRARRSHDGMLGEEGSSTGGDTGVRWVVDPIDGTVNYLYGYPGWSVSIAAEVQGITQVGVVIVPTLSETFVAVRGRGAMCNDRPIHVRPSPALDRALIGTGFGYVTSLRERQAQVIRDLLPQVQDIRRGGSAAVDLCSVAAGRLDGYFERGTHRWDIAAGELIVRESGGVVGGLHGSAASTELAIAASPGLFDLLHDRLAQLEADSG